MSSSPRAAEGVIICGTGDGLVRRVYGRLRRGEDFRPVRRILGNWCQWALAPARFSPHSTPRDTDRPVGLARWPFSGVSLCGIRRW